MADAVDLWRNDFSVVLVGEIHGSREIPMAVEQLALSAMKQNVSISIGLEVEVAEQATVDAYAGEEDAKQLLAGDHWRLEDGRASQAIKGLIDFARREPSARCFCFDAPVAAARASPAHSRAMAAAALPHIRAEIDRGGGVILLAGSAHCRCRGTTFASLLKEALPQTRSLLARWPAKSSVWSYDASNWIRPFGVHKLPTSGLPIGNEAKLLEVLDSSEDGFDGDLAIGVPLTPSPPARHAYGMATENEGLPSCCSLA